jgi:hypothetical protein
MSAFKASKITDTSGVIRGTPVNITTINVPYSSGGVAAGYINERSEFTTSNTASIFTFTYKPVIILIFWSSSVLR